MGEVNAHPPAHAGTGVPVEAGAAALGMDQRRVGIAEVINNNGGARIEQLATRFGVSAMTIHRDLDALAAEGLITRVRGGARPVRAALVERDVEIRRGLNHEIKQQLALCALRLLEPRSVIALDDSTTVATLVPGIFDSHPSGLITHSLALMQEIALQSPDTPMVGLGGTYEPGTGSFLGASTISQISQLNAGFSVVSTTSLRGRAIYHPDEHAARTKTAVLNAGEVRILMVDSSKTAMTGMYHVADLGEFDHVIIDDNISMEVRENLARCGAQLHLVDTPVPMSPEGKVTKE
ncbi:DeoR/GlpR family DNA-binding transcription regulator [Corynebacterium pacaense]|uniref:DeoR/GlpR family DNA-binding transcription regulator n=1 Tax=Corynebacterium pacaense TaxID=1816684 RepID=UPI0015C492D2|nr:DeoR/GlpR family DNA-binding transcription regulator [Corynebacterium pacaense]